MAVHYRTQGFFIKKTDQGEDSRLFTIYTKDFGKLKILGKAIRKIQSKLRSGADLFYLSEIEFIQGKTHKTLTDAILIESFSHIREDLGKLKVAYKIFKVLDDLVKGEESDKEIWGLLTETFKRLNNYPLASTSRQTNDQLLYYFFLWNLFSILGYQPELYHCFICQKKLALGPLYFSLEGGVVCGNCFRKANNVQKINQDLVKIIRLFLNKDWQTLLRLRVASDSQKLLKDISEWWYNEKI